MKKYTANSWDKYITAKRDHTIFSFVRNAKRLGVHEAMSHWKTQSVIIKRYKELNKEPSNG